MSGLDLANIQSVLVYDADYATGLPTSPGCTNNCVTYTWLSGATKLTYSSGIWSAVSQNACAGDPLRDALGVTVTYKHAGMVFFFKNAIVRQTTVMWIEPTTALICKP